MKTFTVKFAAEKFMTIGAESEDELLKQFEQMTSTEMTSMLGPADWSADELSDATKEETPYLVFHDGKFWGLN